jgi:ubiquinone/menaquinone biosynthesis C-methylase UbiE
MGNVKDTHFSISSCRDYNIIIAMRHELDAEDVLGVACGDGGAELELAGIVGWLICVDIQVLIVTTACEQIAAFGPGEGIHAAGVAAELVGDVEIVDQLTAAVEWAVALRRLSRTR